MIRSYFIFFAIVIALLSCTPKSRLQQIAISHANKPAVTPVPDRTITKEEDKQIIEIDRKGNRLTPPTPIEGNLIQTGGSVLVLARQLTIDLNISGSNVSQILAMRDYIQENWHYIHDPMRDKDTWRSADATIALRYKGKFPGDCDDFAILMASLARQIGLESRMLGGFYQGEGHAFAEFKVPKNEYNNSKLKNADYREDYNGYWVSLDWFIGREHNQYARDIIVYEDI
jgi:hypothetical protein